ncbi:MAG: hypothetical protein ACKOT0_06805 [bacterium]
MSSGSRAQWSRVSRGGVAVAASAAMAVGLMVAVPAQAQPKRTIVQATKIEKAMIMNALREDVKPKCVNVAFAVSDRNWGLMSRVKKMPGCPTTQGRMRVILQTGVGWRFAFWSDDPAGCNLFKMPDNVRHDLKSYVRCAREPLPKE